MERKAVTYIILRRWHHHASQRHACSWSNRVSVCFLSSSFFFVSMERELLAHQHGLSSTLDATDSQKERRGIGIIAVSSLVNL